ncbi:MAG: DUF2946 family protein [Pseudomonadota bacterium]
MRAHRTIWLRCLLALAIVFQAIAPGALTAGVSTASAKPSADWASLICAPSGNVSDTAQATADALLSLSLTGEQEDRSDHDHCPHCVIGGAAVLPQRVHAAVLRAPLSMFTQPVVAALHAVGVTGPPLGGRAPPSFH